MLKTLTGKKNKFPPIFVDQNNLKLIEYLINNRFDDDCAHYTIHLVCKIHQQQPSAAVSSQAASNDNSDGLRRRNVHVPDQDNIQAFITRQPTALQTTNTNTPEEDQLESIHRSLQQLISQTPNLSADELAVYHQLYMQYISLNTQFLQQQGSLAAVPVIEGNANGNINNVNNDNREMLPVNAAGVENNAAAAAAGVDPLEYAYSILRVAILFCIMYTHSSFFRLLFVLIALAAVYFFRNRQPADENRQDNNENTNRDEITEAAPENAGNDGDESTADQGAETADQEGIQQQQEQEEPKPNILSVAFTFVSTLVSSILPDNPTNLIQ